MIWDVVRPDFTKIICLLAAINCNRNDGKQEHAEEKSNKKAFFSMYQSIFSMNVSKVN